MRPLQSPCLFLVSTFDDRPDKSDGSALAPPNVVADIHWCSVGVFHFSNVEAVPATVTRPAGYRNQAAPDAGRKNATRRWLVVGTRDLLCSLNDQVKVLPGVVVVGLIIFQMPAHTICLSNNLQQLRYPECCMVERLSQEWVRRLFRRVDASTGVNQYPVAGQAITELTKNLFLMFQGDVPNAIPRGDELIFLGETPGDDIRKVEINVWMPCPCMPKHGFRNIQTFDGETADLKQIDNSATASTAYIDRRTGLARKTERSLVLGNAILTMEVVSIPVIRKSIVAPSRLLLVHPLHDH